MDDNKTIRQLLIDKDEVSLCSFDGTVVGRADKYIAHKYPSQMHLAISVWLFNSKGQTLLQKRSKKKIVGADWWANSVCGNVWPTETYFDCAVRRLKVELGIVNGVQLIPVYKFGYKAYGNAEYGEHELDQVYIGLYEGVVQPNPEEVSEYQWVEFEKLFAQISVLEYISPENSLLIEGGELQEKTPTALVTIGEKEFQISPWTIFMLKNPILFDAYKQILKKNK
ncbi:MAG: hypothetical protein BroJett025_10890 [Patescibacteria group bacterium]|nr:MAG: hypothetical protein BroJett025_10890 [Patescibacteria group bacterium]